MKDLSNTIACLQQWPTTDIQEIAQLLWHFLEYSPSSNQLEEQGLPESDVTSSNLVALDRLFFHELDQSVVELV